MKSIVTVLLISFSATVMNIQGQHVGGITNVDEAEEKVILNKLRDNLDLLKDDRLKWIHVLNIFLILHIKIFLDYL